jgi:hypothetical protein
LHIAFLALGCSFQVVACSSSATSTLLLLLSIFLHYCQSFRTTAILFCVAIALCTHCCLTCCCFVHCTLLFSHFASHALLFSHVVIFACCFSHTFQVLTSPSSCCYSCVLVLLFLLLAW